MKIRAERRAGEMLKEMKTKGERHRGHGDQKSDSQHGSPKPKLKDLGINHNQADRWQKIAEIPTPADFEDDRRDPLGI